MHTLAKVLLATTGLAAGCFGAVAIGSTGVAAMSIFLVVNGIAIPVELALLAAGLAPSCFALHLFFDERRDRLYSLVEKYELRRLERTESEHLASLREKISNK